mmetsp:Transcript_2106/g.6601  ORF Transcript_2106/g.6601 Transcript_2106/m.6601 type:complete len:239 (+) Transcript_2106:82-798(+)
MPPPVTEMWADETRLKEWYEGGAAYWATTEPTNDGVLGGFRVHEADIRDSRAFISPLLSSKPKRGLDVGAGIGRVTGGLLIELCEHVDLLEECVPFVEQARVQLAHAGDRVNFLCMKMQDFAPEAGLYDLIWIQWCLGSLSDADVVAFLQRCRKGLADPGGLLVIKDNVFDVQSCTDAWEKGSDGAKYLVDQNDNSVIRSREHFKALLDRCGLQQVCPPRNADLGTDELYPVEMHALR